MKDLFAGLGGLIVAVVLLVGLVVGGTFGYIALFRKAAPEMADAERATYENSASYIQGKTQEIAKYKREYESSKDAKDKSALRELILTSAATVDRARLPADLRAFLRDLESSK
jgi:hypothetical protein